MLTTKDLENTLKKNYVDFSEAVKCRYEAEEKYFGKYSYRNSITNGAERIERN